MNKKDKKRIIAQLVETRGKLQRLALEQALDGRDTDELERKLKKLDRAINEVRRDLHEQWEGRARDIEDDLRRANQRVQGRIRDINNKVRRAERMVALLDDIVGQVRGILP